MNWYFLFGSSLVSLLSHPEAALADASVFVLFASSFGALSLLDESLGAGSGAGGGGGGVSSVAEALAEAAGFAPFFFFGVGVCANAIGAAQMASSTTAALNGTFIGHAPAERRRRRADGKLVRGASLPAPARAMLY